MYFEKEFKVIDSKYQDKSTIISYMVSSSQANSKIEGRQQQQQQAVDILTAAAAAATIG